MSSRGASIVLTLSDENNPQGVRMVVRDPEQLSFQDFIKDGAARLGTNYASFSKVKLADGASVTRTTDLVTGDKLTFYYTTTTTTSGEFQPEADILHEADIVLHPPRSFRSHCVQYTLTFLLFICLHQTFLWFSTDRHQRAESERIQAKISSMKYPDGVSFDL